jgi:hypothetical protein
VSTFFERQDAALGLDNPPSTSQPDLKSGLHLSVTAKNHLSQLYASFKAHFMTRHHDLVPELWP